MQTNTDLELNPNSDIATSLTSEQHKQKMQRRKEVQDQRIAEKSGSRRNRRKI